MSPPAAAVVCSDCARATALATAVSEGYAALHDSAWRHDTAAERVGGGGHARPSVMDEALDVLGDPDAYPPVPPRPPRIPGSSAVRSKLATAARLAAAAVSNLSGAAAALNQAAELIDEHAGHSEDDPDLYPPTVHPEQLAELEAAHARRDAVAAMDVLARASAKAGRERAKARRLRERPKATPKKPKAERGWRSA